MDTEDLVNKLKLQLKSTYVTYAMRYTPPYAKEAIEELKKKNISNVTILPMYPHYSTTTTKSSLEDFKEACKNLNIKTTQIDRFYDNSTYNSLLIDKIEELLKNKNSQEFELIFSAHSLPQSIIDKGDTYQKEILLHVELLKKVLVQRKILFKNIHVAYQSKLGPVKWLEPSLENKIKSIESKKVIISPISFTIDNSETEFELSIEYKEIADELNFEEYLVAKCPNDSDKFIESIIQITNS